MGDLKRPSRVRRVAKHVVIGAAVVTTSPLILVAKLEQWLSSGEGWFAGIGALLSLAPSKIGDFLRLAFYRYTLQRCSFQVCFQFGTRFSHRTAEIGRDITIGADCCIGTATIADHVLIGSRVSILSGGHQHDVSDVTRNITETEPALERVHIGTNTWIGEGAIIMADVGSRCVVAAGSVVFRPVPDGKMVQGNPARAIPRTFPAAVGGARGGAAP